MATATWKFMLARSRDLLNLGELTQARDRQLQLVLDRSGSLSFNIPMSDVLGSQIYPIEYAVKAYRSGSRGLKLVWSGYVNTVEEDALNDLTQLFPNEKPKILFRQIVGWARYAELFSFEPRTGIFKRFEKTYLGKPPASRLREVGG